MSTHTFVGVSDDAKLSSRVMKPPGGGCSDIFGTGSTQQPESTPRRKNHMASDIFGGGTTVNMTPLRQRATQDSSKLFAEEDVDTKKTALNNENNNESLAEDKEKNKENLQKEEGEAETTNGEAHTPINGEEEAKEEQKLTQPQPRGRVPPGGYSSKLW